MNAQCLNTHIVSDFDPTPAEMAPPLQRTPLELAPVGNKAVDLDFDGGRLSSDAGVVLLKDINDQLGLTRNLAAVLSDPRDPRRINFT
jgi:DDE family transposase